MKSIDKDYKYLNRRRSKFSHAERGLIIAIMVTGTLGAIMISITAWLLWDAF